MNQENNEKKMHLEQNDLDDGLKPLNDSELVAENAKKKDPLAEAEEKIAMLENELVKKNEEAKENYDKFLRSLAEFDNYRKRVNKERQDIYRYGCENLIKNMLPMLDNFQRAMDAAKENQDFKNFIIGIEMIQENLLDILEKEGLKPIKTLGEMFDPHLHDAVMQVESDKASEGEIVEEMQRGYQLYERVIRHSMVKVTKAKEH